MSDIVERLRNRVLPGTILDKPDPLCQAAANEIERLRAQKTALEEALNEFACTESDHPCGCYDQFLSEKADIERLKAENAEQKAEMQKLYDKWRETLTAWEGE